MAAYSLRTRPTKNKRSLSLSSSDDESGNGSLNSDFKADNRGLRERKRINYSNLLNQEKSESDEDYEEETKFESESDEENNKRNKRNNSNSVLENTMDDNNEYLSNRRKNIEERQKMLMELNLCDESKNESTILTRTPNFTERMKRKPIIKNVRNPVVVKRKSARLQGEKVKPSEESILSEFKKSESAPLQRKTDKVSMISEDDTNDGEHFLKSVDWNCNVQIEGIDLHNCSMEEYYAVMKSCKMWRPSTKIGQRTTSLAVHPSQSNLLIIAGDNNGQIALWNLKDDSGIKFEPHIAQVSCVSFSVLDPNKFISTSHDGTVRIGDLNSKSLELVYATSEGKQMHTTWHYEMDNSLYVAHGTGEVRIIDMRAPNDEGSLSLKCHSRSVRTVQCHPTQSDYFLTSSGLGEIGLWDIRHQSRHKPDCINMLKYPKPVSSAFFSANGNRIITTCYDDTIKIFESHNFDNISQMNNIKHSNHTGRFVSVFKAKWFPGREDLFHVSSLLVPKRIQIYNAIEGQIIHNLMSEEYLNTICAVIDVHPTLPLIVGGDAGGKVHFFSTNNDLSFGSAVTNNPEI